MSTKVEMVMTCVGRSSFLRETLPINLPKVDNIIVITTPTDYETHRVCAKNKVTCIETDLFYKHGAPFDKGRALNEGLKKLVHNDWVLLADCDIILLPAHKTFFRDKNLDKDFLYGCRRIILENRSKYLDFIKKIAFNIEDMNLKDEINDEPKEIGVGFFQYFNLKGKHIKEIINQEIFLDDNTFEQVIMPEVNDRNYPRSLKEKGDLHPYFPTAGGSDSQFRHFFAEKKALAATAVPIIHLGKIGSGHSGSSRNFE